MERRVALVTGGGRGIGKAIALGVARTGASVAVIARSADEVDETARCITESGGTALAIAADVSRPDQLTEALGQIVKELGPVEVLVNNAAVVWPLGPSVDLDVTEWEHSLAINVTAVARLSFALLPSMIKNGWGRIANVSSGVAADPAGMLRANAYVTSKAALEAHTLNLARELTDTGVKVNIFRPGGVDTAMQASIRAQDPARVGAALHQRFMNNYQQGALLSPEASAAVLLGHLAGDETGQIWNAD